MVVWKETISLPSGRSVVATDEPERIQVIAPDGTMELEFDLSGDSPLLRVRGSTLSVEATESLRLAAPEIDIQAKRALHLSSEGEVSVHADADVKVTGTVIHLN